MLPKFMMFRQLKLKKRPAVLLESLLLFWVGIGYLSTVYKSLLLKNQRILMSKLYISQYLKNKVLKLFRNQKIRHRVTGIRRVLSAHENKKA